MNSRTGSEEYSVAPGQGVDAIGKVETRGIDQIPDVERNSNPRNMAAAFASVQFCFAIVFFGWLLVSFGLGFWSILTAVTVGVSIGSVIIALMALSGPLTGTNQSVSSGAYFGVRGRLIGSAIALFIDVVFLALIAYTTGQTLVDTSSIVLGTATGTAALVIGMVIACILVVAIGYFGHATLVASYKVWLVVGLIFQVIWVIVLLPNFHLAADGTYLLGDFLPTWLLAVTVSISIPISYITWPNDYGRRMPRSTNPARPRRLGVAGYGGRVLDRPDARCLRHHDVQRPNQAVRRRQFRGHPDLVRHSPDALRHPRQRRQRRPGRLQLCPGPADAALQDPAPGARPGHRCSRLRGRVRRDDPVRRVRLAQRPRPDHDRSRHALGGHHIGRDVAPQGPGLGG